MLTSKSMRENELFLRNSYECIGKWNIPLIKKQDINLENINLIAYSEIKYTPSLFDAITGVHFFIDDYRFKGIYENPQKSLDKVSRFDFLLTPDFSLYADMPNWLQIENVAKNRWCGAFWQSLGLKVIPTISWSLSASYSFCFDGVENSSTVAISTIGCKNAKLNFMRGYNKMLEVINPQTVICYGEVFSEMNGNIIKIPYFRDQL